ncbi:MAG: SDR family oxidoreductase [Candidatus Omnitrophica bacterium]|nr:SDR family oxidoreductase [Candidatus Omnitrophota bacterium]
MAAEIKRRKILVLGATSALGYEALKHFAKDGDQFFLVARNPKRLETVADDLKVRGAGKVETLQADFNDFDRHPKLIAQAVSALGGLTTVLIAHGLLPDQGACQKDYALTEEALRVNFLSEVSLLTIIANQFEEQKQGEIAVITSVAGDRGRASSYVYASAKAALDTFLSGLRNRLAKSNVQVLTIKPGLIETPMTANLERKPLIVKPTGVGRDIYKAILKKKEVLYTPWWWRIIMAVLVCIPEKIFKRTNL